MNYKFYLILLSYFVLFLEVNAQQKHRIVVLTDIENEPDDAQSMVRFLTYSNQWDVEGLIATTSTHLRNKVADWRIREIVTAYGKVHDNLLQHEKGYPTESFLQSLIKKGIDKYGMQGVGEGMDSEGSDWLIQVVDKADERPVWVLVWGGANVLAQALWKVRKERTYGELQAFVKKLRVYTISDQDDAGPWLRHSFPELFYIVSPGEDYRHATWSGISGDSWYDFATGVDSSIVQNPWLSEHIISNHGPLGAEYPLVEYAMEGDSPTFLYLIENGLNMPEKPYFGGWGGRYELYTPRYLPYRMTQSIPQETRPIWTNVMDQVTGKDGRIYIDNRATIWRWREAYQHDFAARMDWCIKPYAEANHPPVPTLKGETEVTLKIGEEITFDASNSSDPDGDALDYEWIYYPETGSFWAQSWKNIQFQSDDKGKLTLKVPNNIELDRPVYTQFILCVTDDGSPSLTRYKRIIVNIMP